MAKPTISSYYYTVYFVVTLLRYQQIWASVAEECTACFSTPYSTKSIYNNFTLSDLYLSFLVHQPLRGLVSPDPSQSEGKLPSALDTKRPTLTIAVADEAMGKTVLPGGVPSYQK